MRGAATVAVARTREASRPRTGPGGGSDWRAGAGETVQRSAPARAFSEYTPMHSGYTPPGPRFNQGHVLMNAQSVFIKNRGRSAFSDFENFKFFS